MIDTLKSSCEHLITTVDRREQWRDRYNAWQAQLMHRYAKRISARHKNPEYSLESKTAARKEMK